jgi:hypothetical protein
MIQAISQTDLASAFFESILSVLEEMKMDIAYYQLQMLRNLLERASC